MLDAKANKKWMWWFILNDLHILYKQISTVRYCRCPATIHSYSGTRKRTTSLTGEGTGSPAGPRMQDEQRYKSRKPKNLRNVKKISNQL